MTEYDMKYYLVALTDEEIETGVNGWDIVRRSDIARKRDEEKKKQEQAKSLTVRVVNGVRPMAQEVANTVAEVTENNDGVELETVEESPYVDRLIEFPDLYEINTYDRGTSMMVYEDEVYLIFKDYLDLSNNRRIYFGKPSHFGCDQRTEYTPKPPAKEEETEDEEEEE